MKAAGSALLFLLLAAGLFGAPARAQENYYNPSLQEEAPAQAPESKAPAAAGEEEAPGAGSFVVTSLQKCYAQLSREDALDIQRSYAKPYQECQRRLALKLKKEKSAKAGAAQDTPAEKKSGGFFSVPRRADGAKKEPASGKNPQEAPRTQEKVPLQ